MRRSRGEGNTPRGFRRRLLKPSPWGPTPLVKGRCREATEGIGKGGWPPGQTDEGTIIERFRFSQGGFAACGRRVTFPAMGKSPKDRRGTPQRRTSFANDGLPPDPIYGGRVPERWRSISGAQNLSGGLNSRRATGPWVCKNYGDCDFIPAPGPVEQVIAGAGL